MADSTKIAIGAGVALGAATLIYLATRAETAKNGIIIAAYDASAQDKARAHLICKGSADEDDINSVLENQAFQGKQNREIYPTILTNGTFIITGTGPMGINIHNSYAPLKCSGKGTVLWPNISGKNYVVHLGAAIPEICEQTGISDLTIDGSSGAPLVGLAIGFNNGMGPGRNLWARNLFIQNIAFSAGTGGKGLTVGGDYIGSLDGLTLENLRIFNIEEYDGIGIWPDVLGAVRNINLKGIKTSNTGREGIFLLNAENITGRDIVVNACGRNGIYIANNVFNVELEDVDVSAAHSAGIATNNNCAKIILRRGASYRNGTDGVGFYWYSKDCHIEGFEIFQNQRGLVKQDTAINITQINNRVYGNIEADIVWDWHP